MVKRVILLAARVVFIPAAAMQNYVFSFSGANPSMLIFGVLTLFIFVGEKSFK